MKTKRDIEAFNLITLVNKALANYNLENGGFSTTLPLNTVITLGNNTEVYAVTHYSVIAWKDDKTIKFLSLDLDDIYALQDIIKEEYDVEL